jgi:EAL domain-containing protein (putative c-di-GMP-specific phosphodiesterase class I)
MIPTFREVEEDVGRTLKAQGGLGTILVDLAPLAKIERNFGGATYQALRAQIDPLFLELAGKSAGGERLARDERDGDRFFVFCGLRDPRDPDRGLAIADLRKRADEIEEFLTPRVTRLTQPYTRERPVLSVGYGIVLYSPLESAERLILRLIEDAQDSSAMRAKAHDRGEKETLIEVIYNFEQTIWTAFQPIVEIQSRTVMGHEGLSRGPRGTEMQPPMVLFGAAARYGLTEELERACRKKAFVDWDVFGAPGRLFVNTVPATVRDASFLGRGVLDYLGTAISPRFVTLEITERQVIENLAMYREAMHAFLELGFSFAIDDLGAGYSGLETVAKLGAAYLKIDMGLVRDVHQKRASQQIIKAILDMSTGVGATVIAEGIQTMDEAKAILDLGVRYGQGYLFARPIDPYAPKPRTPTVVVKMGG